MGKWAGFGEQVNRLVYTLAGKNYQGSIESANRFVAGEIHYSEESTRMMRQGQYRPKDDRALEILVKIGCREAGLEREWAAALLHQGQYPHPANVLQSCYGAAAAVADPPPDSAPAFFAARVLWTGVGSIIFLMLWVMGSSFSGETMNRAAGWLEQLWGLLIGAGLAAGALLADRMQTSSGPAAGRLSWANYSALCAAGLVGSLLWLLIRHIFFSNLIQANLEETAAFGAVYAAAFAAAIFGLYLRTNGTFLNLRPLACLTGMVALVSLITAGGFLTAGSRAAFAEQAGIDLFVGLAMRAGLIATTAVLFPPRTAPTFANPNWYRWLPWQPAGSVTGPMTSRDNESPPNPLDRG